MYHYVHLNSQVVQSAYLMRILIPWNRGYGLLCNEETCMKNNQLNAVRQHSQQ